MDNTTETFLKQSSLVLQKKSPLQVYKDTRVKYTFNSIQKPIKASQKKLFISEKNPVRLKIGVST